MKILQITMNVPLIDLDDDERQELLEQVAFGDQETIDEGLPKLEDYSPQTFAHIITGALENNDEMWAGSDVYAQIDQSRDVEVVSANWLAEVRIDPRTGRPCGDHGEGHHAIQYALEEIDDHYDRLGFLDHWMQGDLSEWPEFYVWLKNHE